MASAALVLFVVGAVAWIRFWGRRLDSPSRDSRAFHGSDVTAVGLGVDDYNSNPGRRGGVEW